MASINEAQKPNPFLQPLVVLVGEWVTTGTHPMVPGKTFHGTSTFEWIEGGAFLMGRTQIEEPEIPSGISIIGSDDATGEYFMLYFDERNISRKYDVSVNGNVITYSRMTPEFSQRMVFTISDDGATITQKGAMSKNGGAWESDLELTYTRKN